MVLATRGWGPEAFRLVEPDFLDACRFAVFAEKVAPDVAESRALMDRSMAGMSPDQKATLAPAKIAARDWVETMTPVLYPEDDDGE